MATNMYLDDNNKIVAAIEFGVDSIGYSFALEGFPYEAHINRTWGPQKGAQTYKVPTCVMTNPDGSFHSFGFDAENNYFSSEPNVQRGGIGRCHLYRDFSILLQNENIWNGSIMKSESGHEGKAKDIITMALVYLRDHLKETPQCRLGYDLRNAAIRWVIIIPDGKTEHVKHLMMEASIEAGLVAKDELASTLVVSDSVAALQYCMSTKISNVENFSLSAEDKAMIINANEGRVDISAYTIHSTDKAEAIMKVLRKSAGGFHVEERFIIMLSEVLGSDFIQYFKKEEPQYWQNLLQAFSRQKYVVEPDEKHQLKVELPYIFATEHRKFKEVDIESVIEGHPDQLFSLQHGYLVFKPATVKQLFADTCKIVIRCISKLLQRPHLKNMQYMLLVGDFGRSRFLQEALQTVFGGSCNILIPDEPEISILQGGISFGCNPLTVSDEAEEEEMSDTDSNQSTHMDQSQTKLKKIDQAVEQKIKEFDERIEKKVESLKYETLLEINSKLDKVIDSMGEAKQDRNAIKKLIKRENPVEATVKSQIENATKYVKEMHAASLKEKHYDDYVYYRIFNIIALRVGSFRRKWRDLAEILLHSYPEEHLVNIIKVIDERHTTDSDKAFEVLMTWKVYTGENTAITALLEVLAPMELAIDADIAEILQIQESKVNEETTGCLSDKALSRLAKNIGHEWQELGYELGYKKARLEQLEGNHPFRLQDRISDLLITWRNSCEAPADAKLVILQKALRKCNRNDLASELNRSSQDTAGPYVESNTPVHSHSSSALLVYRRPAAAPPLEVKKTHNECDLM